MKKQARKLNLNRETLAPMQSDELANVHGGVTPTIAASSAACAAAAAAVTTAFAHTSGMALETRWCRPR
jgi:lactobin A/cerein 7B family class IIb bacteriocin